MIHEEQKSKIKSELLRRQSKLIRQLQDHYGLEISQTDAVGELSSYDNHPGDMATELYEREKDIALNEHTENELKAINEALHAMEEGTYGMCEVCSADIPFERLEANPIAKTCIEHAEEDTFKRERPVEEEVMNSQIPASDITPELQGEYDAEDTWQAVSRYGSSDTPSDFYEDKKSYNEVYINSEEDVGYVEDVEKVSIEEEKFK